MVKSMVVASSIAMAGAASVTLASFGPSDATLRQWKETNDPVMGGKSTGKFTVTDGIGTMEGTVAIVPSLNAPGFINVQAQGTYEDVSSCSGIELDVRTTSNPDPYTGWRFAFGNDKSACRQFFARGYHASFTPPSGDDFGKVQIPFNEFTRCWSDATGEAIKTCADDSSVCPTTARLQDLQSIQVWAEGKVGDVKIDIRSVSGYGCATSDIPLASSELPNIVELAESVKDLSTLVSAVVAGDLADTLSSPGPFTVFAPTNEGFGALPAGTVESLLKPENKAQLADILTYHVLGSEVKSTDLKPFQRVPTVEGKNLHVFAGHGKVKVGPSIHDLKNVVVADNVASNGVVHIIDGVMLPPSEAVVV